MQEVLLLVLLLLCVVIVVEVPRDEIDAFVSTFSFSSSSSPKLIAKGGWTSTLSAAGAL